MGPALPRTCKISPSLSTLWVLSMCLRRWASRVDPIADADRRANSKNRPLWPRDHAIMPIAYCRYPVAGGGGGCVPHKKNKERNARQKCKESGGGNTSPSQRFSKETAQDSDVPPKKYFSCVDMVNSGTMADVCDLKPSEGLECPLIRGTFCKTRRRIVSCLAKNVAQGICQRPFFFAER